MRKQLIVATIAALGLSAGLARPSFADDGGACDIPQSVVNTLQGQLASVVQAPDHNGGIFSPNRMWSAIVDRKDVNQTQIVELITSGRTGDIGLTGNPETAGAHA